MPTRRTFLKTASLALGAVGCAGESLLATRQPESLPYRSDASQLPMGSAPAPLPTPHFPNRLHAFVWRNWQVVPAARMAEMLGASPSQIVTLGRSMGLRGPPRITPEQQRRSALTVIRRNWHLLPYEQLLQLLDWTPQRLAFALREDDFLFVKLGNLKPNCEPLLYEPPDAATRERVAQIARLVDAHFPAGVGLLKEPLFDFVHQLSRPPKPAGSTAKSSRFDPRFCYSYFALYGDPLLEPDLDPYPEGYLARLARSGVNGVWLQAVLARLAPFPWAPEWSAQYEVRLRNLRALVERARRHGVGIYLYLNEPRALPVAFYARHPELQGVVEDDFAALCTSMLEVREYLGAAIERICRAAPGLAGFFTISASENLTNCWSHHGGLKCPRCSKRAPAEVIAELHGAFQQGIRKAGYDQKLIVWDWGWADEWVDDIIAALPTEASFMSVSEWAMPINRGGVTTSIGEYSISTIGPGARARARWTRARTRGLKTLAKVQCGNTWELAAVPYIPALQNVAQHIGNLRQAGVDGLMLGWTLGGYPSPNLEVVAELGEATAPGQDALEFALNRVAKRRFGPVLAPAVVRAWKCFSQAFSEFPFHGSLVYNAPLQLGPANPLYEAVTGYHATMVGFPYDDLDAWRAVYPADVFVDQFEKVANGFELAHTDLATAVASAQRQLSPAHAQALQREINVAHAAATHFRSTANQARFVLARRRLHQAQTSSARQAACAELESMLRAETDAARRLYELQVRDSRLGFEASNQYFYVPADLAEKILNCADLLNRWLPAVRA